MRTTKQPTEANISKIETCEKALKTARENLTRLNNEVRYTGTALELQRQGSFLLPPDRRQELEAAEVKYNNIQSAQKDAERDVYLAQAALESAIKEKAQLDALPAFIEPDRELKLAENSENLAKLKEISQRRQKYFLELEKLRDELTSVGEERERILSADLSIEDASSKLAALPGKSEIISQRLKKSEAEHERLIGLEYEAIKLCVGFTNGEATGLFESSRAAVSNLKSQLINIPIYPLIGLLQERQMQLSVEGKENYISAAGDYLCSFEVLSPEILQQINAMTSLATEIASKFSAWEKNANAALQKIGGDA